MDSPETAGPGWKELVLAAILAAAIPLAYTLYTQNVWEDYFITFRHSKNWAEGKGLVYNVGERIHGFTSPLGTLLPGVFHWLAGYPESFLPALWIFRLVSFVAYAGAAVMLMRTFALFAPDNRLLRWCGLVLFVSEVKGVAFAANGQETGLMLFFVAWSFFLLQKGIAERWVAMGVAWAGLMWTRPDGCIPVAMIGVLALLFPVNASRGRIFASLWKAAAVTTVLYLPWILFTTLYYGSPIPHTVHAKAQSGIPIRGMHLKSRVLHYCEDLFFRLREFGGYPIEPIYYHFGGWYTWVHPISVTFGWFGMLWWVVPVRTPVGRLARQTSLAYLLLMTYLIHVQPFPWYLPPISLFLIATIVAAACSAPATAAGLLTALYATKVYREAGFRWSGPKWEQAVVVFEAAAILAAVALFLAFIVRVPLRRAIFAAILLGVYAAVGGIEFASFRLMKVQQQYIESGNRTSIGRFLKERVRPGENVYLECLGYIGYYSEARMDDFPGLVSPAVLMHRRQGGGQFTIIERMKPTWVVLRQKELEDGASRLPFFRENYELVKKFDALPELKPYKELQGFEYIRFDSVFYVYRYRG